MIQIIYLVLGLIALVKGRINVTARRSLPPARARAVGVVLAGLGVLGLALPVATPDAIPMVLAYAGAGVVVGALALGLSVPERGDEGHRDVEP